MAAKHGAAVSAIKSESAPSPALKNELEDEDDPSSYIDEDDLYEDAGDLDFTNARQQLWLGHVPRSLWETWARLGDEDEIEIGTIRIEGSERQPSRISLKLQPTVAQLRPHPKEYILQARQRDRTKSKRAGQAFLFSEKDLPGHKARPFQWDKVDEDGTPGQIRSYLYEQHKREQKRKENKTRFVPYARRPIPKQTAIQGIVQAEVDCVPVKNDEYFELEAQATERMLKIPEKPHVIWEQGQTRTTTQPSGLLSMAERSRINKQTQARRQAAKDNRSARVPRDVLIDRLLQLFKLHRIWALRELKARVSQPEAYLRDVLGDIAFMWKNGDFNGKWELKPEFKEQDVELMNPTGPDVAPDVEESEVDRSGMEDEDMNETFEDVQ